MLCEFVEFKEKVSVVIGDLEVYLFEEYVLYFEN